MVCSSCSTNELNDPESIKEFFEEWDITIPYRDVSKSKTYKLLEALIDHIDKNQVYIIYYPSSDIFYPSVAKFNEHIWNNKEAAALFEGDDCASVLISTYQKYLKTNRYKAVGDGWSLENHWLNFFEYVLTSEMCMSKMNLDEKVQLMVLALEKSKYVSFKVLNDGRNLICPNINDYNIMISIMLSINYAPFVSNVKPIEASMGALFLSLLSDDTVLIGEQCNDLITGYAKQFITDNK